MKIQRIYDKLAKFKKAQDKPKTVFSKCKYDFSKKSIKPKLSKGNVKLSLMDELKTAYEWLENLTDIATYYTTERYDTLENEYYAWKNEAQGELDNVIVNSGVSMLDDAGTDMNNFLEQVEGVASMLGVPNSEIYENYNETKQKADGDQELFNEMRSGYKSLISQINDGVNDLW